MKMFKKCRIEGYSGALSFWPFLVIGLSEDEKGIIFGWTWWAVVINFKSKAR